MLLTACGGGGDAEPVAATASNAPAAVIQGDLIEPLSVPSAVTASASNAIVPALPPEVAALPVPLPVPDGAQANSAGLLPLGFETLSSFPFNVRLSDPEPGTQRQMMVTDDEIPKAIQELDGRRVLISGYVAPARTQGRGLTEFLLARDPLSCCFGPSPQMNHWIHVKLPRTEQRFRIFQPVTVEGTLEVGEQRRNGSLQSIYRLDGERAEVMKDLATPAGATPVVR